MCIFQNSSNKVIGLRVKMPATADNPAYTLRADALALRDIAPFGRNIAYTETLDEIRLGGLTKNLKTNKKYHNEEGKNDE